MINPLIKIIELFVDENQDAILQSISVVDKPAIEREFMYFSENGRQMLYFQEDEDQRIVISPAMIPDKMIPRKDDKTGEIYYVYFSAETIAKASEYLMKYNKQSYSNINHQRVYSEDMYVMESWIKESEMDKSTNYGFGDLPVGTWFVKFRILNDAAWAKIKSGELRGLSVEGDFLLGTEKYMRKEFSKYKTKYSIVRAKYKRVYKGLSDEEKIKMDELLFLVEMAANDVFDKAEDAVKRSKQLGLNGEIHSFLDPETKTLMYMPGKTMAEYEAMNVDVASLPSYVDEGQKKEELDALLQFAETYTDYPDGAKANAQRALDWAEKNGWGSCGTPVGKQRANQLAKGEPISEDTIARMSAFERHRQNSETPYSEGCGKLMWDAWGGDAGIRWAQNKLEEIRKIRVENTNIVSEAPGAGTVFAAECPIATQDIAVNLANRQQAIDTANYGPLNPNEPSEDYWKAKAKMFKDNIEDAKSARCENCAFFITSKPMLDCIAEGIGTEGEDPYDVIKAGQLGYCEAFDFKCAAARTCDAWVAKAQKDFEIEEDPTLAQDFVRYYSPFQKQIIKDFIKDVVQVYGI